MTHVTTEPARSSSQISAAHASEASSQFGIPELVTRGIYRIGVPLPNNPLCSLNSYVVMEDPRPLIIDLGFDMQECYDALTDGLHALGLSWNDVDVFFTHGHPDHCGLVNRVRRPGTSFYAGFGSFYELHVGNHVHNRGFRAWMAGSYEILPQGCSFPPISPEERQQIIQHSIDYSTMDEVMIPSSDVSLQLLQDGDALQRGRRRFQVIATKGHSDNHLCLYDPCEKLLICGDQLLAGITPVVISFALGESVLKEYISSVEALARLDVSMALSGHRGSIPNVPQRAAELVEHHIRRSMEILSALGEGPAGLVEITKRVSWRNPVPNWEDWPLKQKYFSMGETLSHLSNLESEGLVSHQVREDGLRFQIKGQA